MERASTLEEENERLREALRGLAQEAYDLLGECGASGAAAMFDPDYVMQSFDKSVGAEGDQIEGQNA